eukprot:8252325-Heterocapsa_arctica.AAC.1
MEQGSHELAQGNAVGTGGRRRGEADGDADRSAGGGGATGTTAAEARWPLGREASTPQEGGLRGAE